MAKFKVGDLVERIDCPLYTSSPTVMPGQRFVIEAVSSAGYLKFKGKLTWQSPEHYKKVENHTIIITTNENTGTVKYLRGKKVVKEEKLVRQKGDPHNMKMLAAYAVQKLWPDDGNIIDVHRAGYTGAVAVMNSKNPDYRDGKIIEFISGDCTTLRLPGVCTKFATLNDVKRFFKGGNYKFDVVELHRQ